MPCNSCAQPFTLLRKEKGCPSCGFSFCSKCLANKLFVKKLNKEVKVCLKCKNAAAQTDSPKIEPPDAYFKRSNANNTDARVNPAASQGASVTLSDTDKEIQERLAKLKEGGPPEPSVEEISERLRLLQNVPTTSDAEIQSRLVKLKGVPAISSSNKPQLITTDRRTEQEQADDLLKQYVAQAQIDTVYQDDFDAAITGIESRLQKLKGSDAAKKDSNLINERVLSEEETVDQIVKKYSAEAELEGADKAGGTTEELPFCEICNEDATVRCLGCRYLFCKRCWLDHRDDDYDDGCNRYEKYFSPKNPKISYNQPMAARPPRNNKS